MKLRKSPNEMSHFELNAEIAEHLGYFFAYTPAVLLFGEGYPYKDKMFVELCEVDGYSLALWTMEEIDNEVWSPICSTPNWAGNQNHAQELCLVILDRLNETDPNALWEFYISAEYEGFKSHDLKGYTQGDISKGRDCWNSTVLVAVDALRYLEKQNGFTTRY